VLHHVLEELIILVELLHDEISKVQLALLKLCDGSLCAELLILELFLCDLDELVDYAELLSEFLDGAFLAKFRL